MAEAQSDTESWTWRSQAYAWFVVVLLALGLTLSLADRMIIALMIAPIKHDLHLTDTQVGLIHGLAFTILYVLAGLPLGRIADNGSRRGLITASVIAWSLATAACAAASSFATFFAARMAVGVGEAGLSPAGISLVSDYFPKHQRARPLTFMVLGATGGVGISFMAGGAIMKQVSEAWTVKIPILGATHGWQAIFLLLGVIGLVFSVVLTAIKEPPRHEQPQASGVSVAAVLRLLWAQREFFASQFVGIGLAVLVSLGFSTWIPSMLARRFGWAASRTGLVYGACIAVSGPAGTLFAGWMARRLEARRVANAAQKVAFVSVAIALIPMTVGPLMPDPRLVLACVSLAGFFLVSPVCLAPVMIQQVTPNQFRGQVFAVYLLVMSLMGYALGPFAVAFVSDSVLHNELRVHVSLAIVSGIFLPLSIGVLGLGLRARGAIPIVAAPTPA